MWSQIKSLVTRTLLTGGAFALLWPHIASVDAPPAPVAAAASSHSSSSMAAGMIEMTFNSGPPLESRLPRGNITETQLAMTKSAALSSPEPSAPQSAGYPAEILLLQAIIAQAEYSGKSTNSPARSSGGPGGGSSRRSPDPDLPPEFDPNYENWQKDADIKLNAEKVQSKGKEHPLAVANPDSYLVICLGGCRASSDKIVYKVSRTAAAAAVIAQRRMETTAAQPAGGNGKNPDDIEPNQVACIAGCYANPDISPAMKPRRAEATPKARVVQVAELASAAKAQAYSTPTNAHRISTETRGYLATKRVKTVIRGTKGWRTKIVFASKKAWRYAAKREKIKRIAASKFLRGRPVKRNVIVTEASGFVF